MMEPTVIILRKNFMFQKNEQLMALANTNVDFPDVFGDVCGIKTTLTRRIRPFNVLWLVNVVTVMINLNDLLLYGSYDGSCSTASKYGSVKKIEQVTLAELNNYVLNSPPQSASESLQQAALPRCIQDIIVQNLNFQFKLSEIHFSSTVTDAVVSSAADEAFASKKAPTFKTACYT
ncbi:hypothetical protein Bca4012_045443 [Brassica carinata]